MVALHGDGRRRGRNRRHRLSATILDVVQVGYGPVGQLQAALLGRAGHRVEVIERHTSLYHLARAGHVDHEVMRMLQGIGAADELRAELIPVDGHMLLDKNLDSLAGISMARWGASGWRSHYNFYQPVFEAALDRAVRTHPSVTVTQGWEAVALAQHADYVELTVRPTGAGNADSDRVIRARYLIGVDGANSAVREMAGLEWQDLGYSGQWLVCDFEHHDPDIDLGWSGASHILDPARPATRGRWLGRRHSRLEFMLLPDERPENMAAEELSWTLASRLNITVETSRLIRHAVYQFRSVIAPHWRAGRVLLAGDAAHLMPPFLGQGLCTGLRDANNLAWKLDLVLRGRAAESLLDRYADERQPQARTLIEGSTAVGSMLNMLDPEAASNRDAALRANGLPSGPDARGVDVGVLQREADGSLRGGVGELCLQAVVSRKGEIGLLDDIIGTGWHVLCRRPPRMQSLTQTECTVLALIEAKVVHLSPSPTDDALCDLDGDYDTWFRLLDAEIVIVRPDFHAFAVLSSVEELGAALRALADELQLLGI